MELLRTLWSYLELPGTAWKCAGCHFDRAIQSVAVPKISKQCQSFLTSAEDSSQKFGKIGPSWTYLELIGNNWDCFGLLWTAWRAQRAITRISEKFQVVPNRTR